MLSIVGIVVLFVMVFGGYVLAGGKIGIILKALPFEMMMIGGAAIAALLISSSMGQVKGAFAGFGRVISGPRWKAVSQSFDLAHTEFFAAKRLEEQVDVSRRVWRLIGCRV